MGLMYTDNKLECDPSNAKKLWGPTTFKEKREVKEPPHPPGQREHHKRKRQNQSLPAKIFTKTLKHKHQTI